MKKIYTLLLITFSIHASAQSLIGGNNILKTNLSADALNNYNLTFERSINHFISLSVNYKSMPLTSLPLKALAKNPVISLGFFIRVFLLLWVMNH